MGKLEKEFERTLNRIKQLRDKASNYDVSYKNDLDAIEVYLSKLKEISQIEASITIDALWNLNNSLDKFVKLQILLTNIKQTLLEYQDHKSQSSGNKLWFGIQLEYRLQTIGERADDLFYSTLSSPQKKQVEEAGFHGAIKGSIFGLLIFIIIEAIALTILPLLVVVPAQSMLEMILYPMMSAMALGVTGRYNLIREATNMLVAPLDLFSESKKLIGETLEMMGKIDSNIGVRLEEVHHVETINPSELNTLGKLDKPDELSLSMLLWYGFIPSLVLLFKYGEWAVHSTVEKVSRVGLFFSPSEKSEDESISTGHSLAPAL